MLVCASNENDVLTELMNTGVYNRNRPFHTTISPSMDILISSNLERLLYELSGCSDEIVRQLMESLSATGRYQLSENAMNSFAGVSGAAAAARRKPRPPFGTSSRSIPIFVIPTLLWR